MISSLALALGIISSSFFGSWHCAGMCSPIASLMSTKKSLIPYHMGRLVSYTTLGIIAGWIGQFFINSEFSMLRWISGCLLSLVLLTMGLSLVHPKLFADSFKKSLWSQKILKLIKRMQAFHISKSGFMVGILTAMLPCGWLYTFVTAAISTRNPFAGATTMVLFWLGGIPALSAVPLMVRKSVQSAGLKQQRIAGVVLIIASIYSVISFFVL